MPYSLSCHQEHFSVSLVSMETPWKLKFVIVNPFSWGMFYSLYNQGVRCQSCHVPYPNAWEAAVGITIPHTHGVAPSLGWGRHARHQVSLPVHRTVSVAAVIQQAPFPKACPLLEAHPLSRKDRMEKYVITLVNSHLMGVCGVDSSDRLGSHKHTQSPGLT